MCKLDKILNNSLLQEHLEDKFYTYIHLTEDTEEVFYVGKGKKDRCCSLDGRSLWWEHVVNKHGFVVVIDKINLDEQAAFDREKELISFYGRRQQGGVLVNLTDGGEGVSGRVFTLEDRKKISDRVKANLEQFQNFGNRSKYFGKQLFGSDNPNYGNRGALNSLSKKVIQMSLAGDILSEYPSLTEAALENNTTASAISAVCLHKRNQLKGYVYRFEGDTTEVRLGKTNKHRVLQLDKNTLEVLKEYESASATSVDGFSPNNVSQVCRKAKKTHKGYIWVYKDEYSKN